MKRLTETLAQGPQERFADLVVVILANAIAGVPSTEAFEGRGELLEPVEAPDDDRQGLHQDLALLDHVGPAEETADGRIQVEQTLVEEGRRHIRDRLDLGPAGLDHRHLLGGHRGRSPGACGAHRLAPSVPVRSSLTGPSAGGDRRPSTAGHGRMSTLRHDGPSRTTRDPAALRPATHPGPRTGSLAAEAIPRDGIPVAGLPQSGFRRPTGSPPMADRTRSLGSGMLEDSRYAACSLPVFKPIAYESTGACHDETSSSGRVIPSPVSTRAGRAIRFGWAQYRATRATGSCWTLRVGTQRADGLGKAAVGHMQCRRPASPRHDNPSSGSSIRARPTADRRPAGAYALVAPPGPAVQPWFENVGMNR